MRFLLLLAYVVSLAISVVSAVAQDTPPPGPMTAQQCGAAYVKVTDDLKTCFGMVPNIRKLTPERWAELREKEKAGTLDDLEKMEVSIYRAWHQLKEAYLLSPDADFDFSVFQIWGSPPPTVFDPFNGGPNVEFGYQGTHTYQFAVNYCENAALARLTELKGSCTSSAPQLFSVSSCTWHDMIDTQCESQKVSISSYCSKFKASSPKVCVKGAREIFLRQKAETGSMKLSTNRHPEWSSCPAAVASSATCIKNKCNDLKGTSRQNCLADCDAAAGQLWGACQLAAGLGYPPDPKNPESPGSKTAVKKTSITSVQSNGVTAGSQKKLTKVESPKLKGGLDRFDLGPSFVSGDSSVPGSRGKTAGASRPKTSGTTTIAPKGQSPSTFKTYTPVQNHD